jgi:hypothetical protein
MGHPVPGRYKYGDLALQVGGVSNETVKYNREFCGTDLARPRSNCVVKLQTHPFVREGAPYQEPRNHQKDKRNLVMGSRCDPDTNTDWPTDCG